MRILLVSQNAAQHGGSDAVFLREIELLTRAGHQVLPVCAREDDLTDLEVRFSTRFPKGASFENPGIGDLVNYIFNRAAKQHVKNVIEKFKPEICHLHIFYGKMTSSILGPLRSANIPTVQTYHEYRSFCQISTAFRNGQQCYKCSKGNYLPGLINRCNRNSLLRSGLSLVEMYVSDALGGKQLDTYFCVSEQQQKIIVQQGMPDHLVKVIYNPIADVFFQNGTEATGEVLYVGRLERYKGIDILAVLARRLPDLSFKIIGTGEYAFEFAQKVADLPNVTLTGALPSETVAAAMRGALCLVVPSIWQETFGLISAEAMAAGTPVIGAMIGGIPEVVSHGIDGLLVQPGDTDGFEQAIRTLVDNPNLRKTLSINGRETAARRFSGEAHVAALVAAYNDIVGAYTHRT